MKRRVFLLGIDGGSWNLLDPLMEAGFMPNLSRLCTEGCKAVLESTRPPVTPVAWTTLMTGTNPGKHGIFGFTHPSETNSYLPIPCNRLNMSVPTLFDYYADGDGIVSLNLPMSYPATPIHGTMITGMMTPLTDNAKSDFPEGTLAGLKSAGIDYVIDPKFQEAKDLDATDMFRQRQEAGLAFVKTLSEITRQRMRVVHHLLDTKEWELFIAVITGTDRLQHLHWNALLSPSGKLGDRNLLEYYTLVDEEIGRLVERLDREDTLLIASDHGFARLHGEMSANTWLHRKGFIQKREARNNLLVAVKNILKKIGLTRSRITGLIGSDRASTIHLKAASTDWNNAKALNDSPLGIRVNLAGRETLGTVSQDDYENVRTDIIAGLRDLRDDDGEPAIDKVYRREEIYSGDQTGSAPDIVFLFREEKLYTAYSSGFTEAVFRKNPYKEADHSMNGIFVAYGGGARNLKDTAQFHIQDILPTIMHLNGRKIPAICDGRVLEEILADRPVDITLDNDWRRFQKDRDSLQYDQAEVDEIGERLKALGYFE